MVFFFFFKQNTASEMRISDWSSDVCSSDLRVVIAMWPLQLSVALGEGLVLCSLVPVPFDDRAIEILHDLLEHALQSLVTRGEPLQRCGTELRHGSEVGRASWRERVWQSV